MTHDELRLDIKRKIQSMKMTVMPSNVMGKLLVLNLEL